MPREATRVMFYVATGALITAAHAFYVEVWEAFVGLIILYITTIGFWSNPDVGSFWNFADKFIILYGFMCGNVYACFVLSWGDYALGILWFVDVTVIILVFVENQRTWYSSAMKLDDAKYCTVHAVGV